MLNIGHKAVWITSVSLYMCKSGNCGHDLTVVGLTSTDTVSVYDCCETWILIRGDVYIYRYSQCL